MQRALVERARDGDLDAFSQLAKASFPRLDGVATLILRDPERAQDAVQEALFRAWRDLRALRDPDAWDAWLRRLTVRACYDVARKERRRTRMEVQVEPDPASAAGPDATADVADRDWLGRELGRLDIDQRAVIVLHYYLDLPVTEVAEILDIPLRDGSVPSPSRPRSHALSDPHRPRERERPGDGASDMNDQKSFERFLSERFDDVGPGRRMPDAAHDDLLSRAHGSRQRPQWLALIKEPPMRISSNVAVGSPMVRVAAIMIATLLLALMVAGAGVAGSRLLAADGTIVVDQSGNGTTTTITEALAIAEDGDTILVKPGTYAEAVIIDKDVTLSGDGEREAITISFDDGKTPLLSIIDTDADVSNLTLTGENSQVLVSGGAPTLQGLLFDGVGIPYAGGSGQSFAFSLKLTDGTRARVTGNTFVDGGEVNVWLGSAPLIDDNELSGGPHIFLPEPGDGTVIRGNTVSGALVNGIAVRMKGSPLIEDNTIIDAGSLGIRAIGTEVIRDNTISGSPTGISVLSGAQPTIEGNEFTDNRFGISLGRSDALVVGNTITGGDNGIVLTLGGSPTLDGNTVGGASNRGIVIGHDTSPTLTGNTICDNATNLFVAENAAPVLEDNEICEDVLAEPSE